MIITLMSEKGEVKMKIVDNRGLACPQPVINTKKALDELTEGTIISITDNAVARENVLKFARSQGCVAEATEEGGHYKITITRGKSTISPEPFSGAAVKPHSATDSGATLYLVGADEMGRGDSTLGKALMKTFIYSLSESCEASSYLVFLNSGVKLACSDSQVLESLRRLQENQWSIMSCGTCLDFFGLKEQLAIGEITNMYTIVELMQGAAKVVTL
jgi:tRNA 2-thiouridine synthesizing protein A